MSGRKMRSVEASRAIWNAGAPSSRSEILVLQALASHADQNFECHPSVRRLAEMTRLSDRQVIRIIHALRQRGLLAFHDNHGGQRKCNHYRLLVAANPDTANPDINNTDSPNSDILGAKGDKSNTETLTNSHLNPDIAVSGEWLEGFKNEWVEWWERAPILRDPSKAFSEIDEDVTREELLRVVMDGVPLKCNTLCDEHGTSFIRHGTRVGHWIAWSGSKNVYGGFDHDAGCPGCKAERDEAMTKYPERLLTTMPVREFELRTPVCCPDHGNYILDALLWEFADEAVSTGRYKRLQLSPEWNSLCPECEADWMYEIDIAYQLNLSAEEWERGRSAILEGLRIARADPEVEIRP